MNHLDAIEDIWMEPSLIGICGNIHCKFGQPPFLFWKHGFKSIFVNYDKSHKNVHTAWMSRLLWYPTLPQEYSKRRLQIGTGTVQSSELPAATGLRRTRSGPRTSRRCVSASPRMVWLQGFHGTRCRRSGILSMMMAIRVAAPCN